MHKHLHDLATRSGVAPTGLCRDGDAAAGGLTTMINRLEGERGAALDFIERTCSEAATASRDLSATEQETLASTRSRIGEIDQQLERMRGFEELRATHRQSGSRFQGTEPGGSQGGGQGGEPRQLGATTNPREYEYRSAGEFLADGWRMACRNDDAATERLRTHGVSVENGQLVRAAAPHTTTAEIPGLLPKPIIGEVMSDIDAARPFISSVGAKDMGSVPGKTFTRPTVTQHLTVGPQSAEKAELEDGQFKVGGVDFTKGTFGGWTNVSRQAIDWSSPAAWDALLSDFEEQYGIQTENAAAAAFATAVTATVEMDGAISAGLSVTMTSLVEGLYKAAALSYGGSGRLPDTIWASLDWWVQLGVLIDTIKATQAGSGGGDSSPTSFTGNLLQTNRVIVPSLPAGTLIVGVKSRTEVYEDRIGFLSAVQPKVLGVELAYGGYMASGTIKPAAFAKLVNVANDA